MKATRICPAPDCPDPYGARWRPVIGYEGIYEVSSHGDIQRVGRAARNGNGARVGRILKRQRHKGGYWQIQLWRDGHYKRFLVHVLVAAAFIGPRPEGHEVNHKDGIKTNTCAGNLEYVTPSENLLHAWRIGLCAPRNWVHGEKQHLAKLTESDVREIRRRYQPRRYGTPRLAREFGVDHSTIYNVVTYRTWKEVI